MSKQNILDLDKLVPEQRILRLNGKDIDVSKIPSRVMLDIIKNKDKMEEGGGTDFETTVDLAVKICKPSFPEITKDWLYDNTDFTQLMGLLEFVLKPLKDRAEKSSGKNAVRPSN